MREYLKYVNKTKSVRLPSSYVHYGNKTPYFQLFKEKRLAELNTAIARHIHDKVTIVLDNRNVQYHLYIESRYDEVMKHGARSHDHETSPGKPKPGDSKRRRRGGHSVPEVAVHVPISTAATSDAGGEAVSERPALPHAVERPRSERDLDVADENVRFIVHKDLPSSDQTGDDGSNETVPTDTAETADTTETADTSPNQATGVFPTDETPPNHHDERPSSPDESEVAASQTPPPPPPLYHAELQSPPDEDDESDRQDAAQTDEAPPPHDVERPASPDETDEHHGAVPTDETPPPHFDAERPSSPDEEDTVSASEHHGPTDETQPPHRAERQTSPDEEDTVAASESVPTDETQPLNDYEEAHPSYHRDWYDSSTTTPPRMEQHPTYVELPSTGVRRVSVASIRRVISFMSNDERIFIRTLFPNMTKYELPHVASSSAGDAREIESREPVQPILAIASFQHTTKRSVIEFIVSKINRTSWFGYYETLIWGTVTEMLHTRQLLTTHSCEDVKRTYRSSIHSNETERRLIHSVLLFSIIKEIADGNTMLFLTLCVFYYPYNLLCFFEGEVLALHDAKNEATICIGRDRDMHSLVL